MNKTRKDWRFIVGKKAFKQVIMQGHIVDFSGDMIGLGTKYLVNRAFLLLPGFEYDRNVRAIVHRPYENFKDSVGQFKRKTIRTIWNKTGGKVALWAKRGIIRIGERMAKNVVGRFIKRESVFL